MVVRLDDPCTLPPVMVALALELSTPTFPPIAPPLMLIAGAVGLAEVAVAMVAAGRPGTCRIPPLIMLILPVEATALSNRSVSIGWREKSRRTPLVLTISDPDLPVTVQTISPTLPTSVMVTRKPELSLGLVTIILPS